MSRNWFRNEEERDRQVRYEGYGMNTSRQTLFDKRPVYDEPPEYRQAPPRDTQGSGRTYSGIIVYQPKNSEDVQTLIDYLKRKEPAIVNLDAADEETSQRILDFISGAVYALCGSVHRVSGNIFLLTPEGVDISIPY